MTTLCTSCQSLSHRRDSLVSPVRFQVLFFLADLLSFVAKAHSYRVEWCDFSSKIASSKMLPRSGHVAFGLDGYIHVFGGYIENEDTERYPTNELWKLVPAGAWKPVPWRSQEQPQPRLAMGAAVTGKKTAHVFGGWDPRPAGTGGEILSDVVSFRGDDYAPMAFSGALGEPTSRLVAVAMNENQVILHNHRSNDHVFIWNPCSHVLVEQPTKGPSPSPRGLHAATKLSPNKMLIFAGAAQDQTMCQDVWILDTDTWRWTELKTNSTDGPCPRAAPCLISLDETHLLVFGGAAPSPSVGLEGLDDLWLLRLDESACEWQRLSCDITPPGRNAATLCELDPRVYGTLLNGNCEDGTRCFLLTGGWFPFRNTYQDAFVLKVQPHN